MKRNQFQVSVDQAFDRVIQECAQIRIEKEEGTWITDEMIIAYIKLHQEGYAHSVEVWEEDRLAGGL